MRVICDAGSCRLQATRILKKRGESIPYCEGHYRGRKNDP